MSPVIKVFTETIALGCELIAIALIAIGAVEAVIRLCLLAGATWRAPAIKKSVWLHFAAWLVLSLEFTLAADVVRTAIAPTWDAIGQLSAIAAVRTLLNYFLTRDIEKAGVAEQVQKPIAQSGATPP